MPFFFPVSTAIKRLQIQKYKEGEVEEEALLSKCEMEKEAFQHMCVYMYVYMSTCRKYMHMEYVNILKIHTVST